MVGSNACVKGKQESLANAKVNRKRATALWHLRRPLSCLTPHYLPNPCEYLHNPYIARNYTH